MRVIHTQLTLVAVALAASLSQSLGESPVKRLEEQEFGKTPEGVVVKLFTLRNAKGMSARVMTYGAIITEIKVPDRRGSMTNVVLGADNFD
jgi:aldose 1-epimerase